MALPKVKLPLRETAKSSWLSNYRLFWRGSVWEPFLLPATGGFAVARLAPHCLACTVSLPHTPGVYELALVKDGNQQRYKVYVGQTGNLHRRFHQDYRGITGSHLRPFFDEALKNGCQIWRRYRPLATAEAAKKQEAKLLKRYDYAWNTRQAGCQPRHINILVQHSCFSKSTRLVAKPAAAAAAASGAATGKMGLSLSPGPLGASLSQKLQPSVYSTACHLEARPWK